MSKTILIKPIVTEKANLLINRRNQYAFVVNRDANKLEIAKAIQGFYEVTVESINTCVMPSKAKNRNTKTAILRGRRSPFKKAYVTLAAGESIDVFGAAGEGEE